MQVGPEYLLAPGTLVLAQGAASTSGKPGLTLSVLPRLIRISAVNERVLRARGPAAEPWRVPCLCRAPYAIKCYECENSGLHVQIYIESQQAELLAKGALVVSCLPARDQISRAWMVPNSILPVS